MKLFLTLAVLLFSLTSTAELVRVKFSVRTTHFSPEGKEKRLDHTRTFIQYNDELTLPAESKKDCRVTIGKKDLGSFWAESESHACISGAVQGQHYVSIDDETLKAIFYRASQFDFFFDSLSEIAALILTKQTIVNLTEDQPESFDLGEPKNHLIALEKVNHFELKSTRTQLKIVVEMTPVKTVILKPKP